MSNGFDLHSVAPRLARARDQFIAEREAAARAERRHRAAQLRLERLVAHRELQLLRAGARGGRAYIAHRARKLAAAKRGLDDLMKTPPVPTVGADGKHTDSPSQESEP